METDPLIQISKSLRRLMGHKGLSISELSHASGIPASTLHAYVHGGCPRGISIIARLAQFFEVPVDEIIFNEEYKKLSTFDLGDDALLNGTVGLGTIQVTIEVTQK